MFKQGQNRTNEPANGHDALIALLPVPAYPPASRPACLPYSSPHALLSQTRFYAA